MVRVGRGGDDDSGLLARESNTLQVGSRKVVLKYHEPPNARLPSTPHHLYVFSGTTLTQRHLLSTQTCWLIGRDATVADLHIPHASVSKQQAAIQFRHVVKQSEWGDRVSKTKAYVVDLESGNGTKLNGEKVESGRYVELRDGDVLKLGRWEGEMVIVVEERKKKDEGPWAGE